MEKINKKANNKNNNAQTKPEIKCVKKSGYLGVGIKNIILLEFSYS